MARRYLGVCDCGATSTPYPLKTHAVRWNNRHVCGAAPAPARRPVVVRRDETHTALLRLGEQYARALMRRYRLPDNEWTDVLSDALLGVAQAHASYNGTGRWGPWAWRRAQGAVIDGLRDRSVIARSAYQRGVRYDDLPAWQRAPVSVDQPLSGGEPDLTLGDAIGGPGGMDDAENRVALDQALACLTKRERRVLVAHDVQGYRLHEIAEALGVTEARVSQIRTAALRKARTAANAA